VGVAALEAALLIICEYLPARREVWLMVQVVGLCWLCDASGDGSCCVMLAAIDIKMTKLY
jgi:hypothetical protein